MIKLIFNNLLLIVFITIGNFCFGQSLSTTYLILDSADVNNHSLYDCCTYYKGEIISSKSYYNYWPNRVHYEFVRLGKDKYYCTEYDSAGKRLQEGIAIKGSKPFQTFEIPVYNNNGEVIKTKKALNFKLGKDEEWTEYDSAYLNFKRGFYKKGVKEGKWTVVKNEHEIECVLIYSKGVLIKKEQINLAGTESKEIRKTLINKWAVLSFSTTNRQQFIPTQNAETNYILLNNDGSCSWKFRGTGHSRITSEKGKWELFENNSKLRLILTKNTIEAEIIYLSKFGLTLKFSE